MRSNRVVIACLCLAHTLGLATSHANAEAVTIHFSVANSVAGFGDTLNWTVSASFTGFPDASAYFGGLVGSFIANHDYGELVSYTNLMAFEGVEPVGQQSDITNINIFNSALLGSNDPANPIDIFRFDMLITTHQSIWSVGYEAEGLASVFPDDSIFGLPTEFTEFNSSSDFISINPPAPGSAVVLGLAGLLSAGRRRT